MLYGPANLSIHVYSLCHPCSVILVIAHHWVYRTISQQPWVLPSGLSDLMWFDVAQLESPAIKLQNGRCHWSSSGWCFGTFCIFHNIWDNPSHWLIFFKMVETTNQLFLGSTPRGGRVFFHVCALWQYTCLTLLPTVRWRYRRHVAQLCCWRLATLTGRGGGGGGMITFLSTVKTPCYTRMVLWHGQRFPKRWEKVFVLSRWAIVVKNF